jgi:hypothetical protein
MPNAAPATAPAKAPAGETPDEFRRRVMRRGVFSAADRRAIVDQATLLLDTFYAHLPLKRAMLGVDPVQQLRFLRYSVLASAKECSPDYEFHLEMLRVFAGLRDLHTNYILPADGFDVDACLPVLIERYGSHGREKYLLTAIVGGREDKVKKLRPGYRVTHWNGVPMARFVRTLAELRPGSHAEARQALAVTALTIRPVRAMPLPDEDWVELRCRSPEGKVVRERLHWEMLPRETANQEHLNERNEVVPRSLDVQTELIRGTKATGRYDTYVSPADPADRIWESSEPLKPTDKRLDQMLRAALLNVDGTKCGYLRIFSFSAPSGSNGLPDVQAFVGGVGELLERLKQGFDSPDARRLIVDVRGNGGGSIPAAERLLQFFAKRDLDIFPELGQVLSSSLVFDFLRFMSEPGDRSLEDLLASSISNAIQIGDIYSRGFPVTAEKDCNDLPRDSRFGGKVLLVIDAASSSAAEMFAAGFQDHGLGPVLGTSSRTAGAGALVRSHFGLANTFDQMARNDGVSPALMQLPNGVQINVAFRRMLRVGTSPGAVLEGAGVSTKLVHATTRQDLQHRNIDLIRRAVRELKD